MYVCMYEVEDRPSTSKGGGPGPPKITPMSTGRVGGRVTWGPFGS